jgi:hypothetical protein
MKKTDEILLNSLPKEMKELIESKLNWVAEKKEKPADLSPNKRIYCNICKGKTNHICKHNSCEYHLISSRDTVSFYTWGNRLWMCAGCESFTLEKYTVPEYFDFGQYEIEEFDSEELAAMEEMEDESSALNVDYFPKRTENDLVTKNYAQLPARLRNIYRELILAFNNETPILCAVGIRALIEGICFDHEIAGRNLEKKIEGMTSILPKNIVSNLHNLRFMGNEAAHELSTPSQQELQLAIEICEDLLNYLYELDYKASYLNQVRNRQKPFQSDFDSDLKIWC